MKKDVSISIIIPAYNIERYIRRCLESVAVQDYGHFEVIVINDGSTDGTERIIKEFISDKPNFILKSQDNMGLSGARNTGIDLCTNEYIMFLDGDDELGRGALSEMAYEIESNKLDAVFFDAVYLNEDGKIIPDISASYNRPDVSACVQSGEELFTELMKKHRMLVCACFYAFKRDILDGIKLRFYPGIIHEDCLFTPWLMFACNRVKHLNRLFYRYYNNSNSIMTSKNDHKEAENYGIVVNELVKKYRTDHLAHSTKRYYREYCISMYLMGKASYEKLDDPDREMIDLYDKLKTPIERYKSRNRIVCLVERYLGAT